MRLQRLFLCAITIAASIMVCGNAHAEKGNKHPKNDNNTTEGVEIADGDAAKADYIIISKESMTLKLYDSENRLVCRFNVAVGKNYGNKQRSGDMKTPEGDFEIQDIQDASKWGHDFGDGKGYIPNCYGNWFLRLKTPPHKGIGIHGTHLPNSIGTRATEGCVRLRNDELDSLKKMVRRGMAVRIEPSKNDLIADGKNTKTTEAKPAIANNSNNTTIPREPKIDIQKRVIHTVTDGDLGGAIAIRYGISLAELKKLNPGVNIDRLSIGQELVVGPMERTTDNQKPAQQPTEKEGEVWHTVVSGETLSGITEKYGVYWEDILPLNPGMNPDKLRLGQRIRIK